MSTKPRSARPPVDGVWRVGRGPDPLAPHLPDPDTLRTSRLGNRFDSPNADYPVLYFSSTLEGCFAETLSRLRPSPSLAKLVRDEWLAMGFMEVGAVPAEWWQRRSAARVLLDEDYLYLDVESAETIAYLRTELALGLSSLGYSDLDLGMICGPDRRVTRLISNWAFEQADEGEPLYGGIRYKSRLGDQWECWAIFEDAITAEVERRSVHPSMAALQSIASLFELQLHGS